VTSGALGDAFEHRARLELSAVSERGIAFSVAPEWSVREMPTVIERGRELASYSTGVFHELSLEARLRTWLSRRHALDLVFKEMFLKSWQKDPLFPIIIPDRGFGIAWKMWGA
jgi:hypothetical protein